MSPRAAAEFSRQWPALQSRLRSFLRNKGVGAGEIDDLVQEVATRLLSYWHKLDRDKPVWPLTATIALNLLRDRSRRPDLEVLGDLPDAPASFDAEQVGMARMELENVLRAMDELTPAQRSALLQAIEPQADEGRSTPAEKMLRMRARRRLANAVGRACGGFALKIRRAGDAVHALFSKTDAVAQALACATCLLVTTAGGASLYPEAPSLGLDGTPRSDATVTVTGVTDQLVLGAGSSVTADEVLSPDRLSSVPDASSVASRGKPQRAKTSQVAAEGEGSAPGVSTGTSIPALPGQAPIPGQAPVPAPPGGPDSPPEAPPVQAETSPPSGPALPEPTDVPVTAVQDVTRTVAKATG